MLQRLVEEKKKREEEKTRIENEAFAKAHASAIENNETHVNLPPYLPVCLTKMSGTRVLAATAKDPVPVASVLTERELSANTALTSADNASEKKPQTSGLSSTAKSN